MHEHSGHEPGRAERILLSWSGGKDSALALHELLRDERVEVAGLLTTVTEGYDRVSIHGVRRGLLHRQAAALGRELHEIYIPKNASNEEYEARMVAALEAWHARGVTAVAAGDLFLEDVRAYRERLFRRAGFGARFPLWGLPTERVAARFLELGYQAVLTCVDGDVLDGSFAGAAYDEALLARLPEGVDPCGERGEFHTFVHAGPIFSSPVLYSRGEVVLRDERFWFADLIEP